MGGGCIKILAKVSAFPALSVKFNVAKSQENRRAILTCCLEVTVNFRYGIVSEYGHSYWVVLEPDETSDANYI
jgi:hypothetical protein